MDRTRVCGTLDGGSIPPGGTMLSSKLKMKSSKLQIRCEFSDGSVEFDRRVGRMAMRRFRKPVGESP